MTYTETFFLWIALVIGICLLAAAINDYRGRGR